jgi:membrane protease YdiL (CAAX protease family)
MNMTSSALCVTLVAYLAFVSPLLGKRSYDRLKRGREYDSGEKVFIRMFGLWMAELWALAAVALLIVGLSTDLDLKRVGFALPTDPSITAGGLVGLAVTSVVVVLMVRRSITSTGMAPNQAGYEALIPRTPVERWFALAMSVTAGICEEIVYRGVLIALGVHLLGLPTPVAAGLALAVFVAGHLYQGWKGMGVVTLAGLALTLLYLITGSLVLPIVVHALSDMRSLLLTTDSRPDRIDSTATVQG